MHDFTFIKKNERLTDRTTGNNNSSLGLGIACNRFAIHLRIAATLPRFPSRSQTPLHSAWPVSLRAPKNGRTPLHPFRSALTRTAAPLFTHFAPRSQTGSHRYSRRRRHSSGGRWAGERTGGFGFVFQLRNRSSNGWGPLAVRQNADADQDPDARRPTG